MIYRIARCLGVAALCFVMVACATEPDRMTGQVLQPAQDDNAGRGELQAANPAPVVMTPGYYINLQPAGAEDRALTIVMRPGSLHANLERIGHENGWTQVVWGMRSDYQWTGLVTVAAPDLQTALQRLLGKYPIRILFYEGNRTMLIQPRTF